MSRRNLIWSLGVLLLALLFWRGTDTVIRRQSIYEAFGPLAEVRATIHKDYVGEVTDEELLEGAIEGMLQKLDPYCRYIPPKELARFEEETNGTFPGIGIYFEEQDGKLIVVSPMEESPALQAGILPGDQILKINGELTDSMSKELAAEKITGPAGTEVVIEVKHAQSGRVETLKLNRIHVRRVSVRGFVRDPDGRWEYMIDKQNGIAYALITDFHQTTAEELDEVFLRHREEPIRGLILDLRDNPGGTLQSAVSVADRFIEDGPIVSTRRKNTPPLIRNATHDMLYEPVPVAVLVNRLSASAAEILAGALKDHHRAVTIGERTYGKGSVQEVIKLDNGRQGAVKLTTAHYYLPSGRNIHRHHGAKQWGVDPDIEVVLTDKERLEVGESRIRTNILYSPTSAGATTRPVVATQPQPLVMDRQLAEALKVIRSKLKSEPASPEITTQPVAHVPNENER